MGRQNGTGADHLTFIVEELRVELAAGDAAVGQAEAALVEARSKRAKIARAIDTLTGETKTKGRPRETGKKRGWIIGEGKVDQMRVLMAAKTEPVTVSEMAQEAGFAKESARRSLEVLRERDLVRMAGIKRAARGQGQKTYLPMPELTDAS